MTIVFLILLIDFFGVLIEKKIRKEINELFT